MRSLLTNHKALKIAIRWARKKWTESKYLQDNLTAFKQVNKSTVHFDSSLLTGMNIVSKAVYLGVIRTCRHCLLFNHTTIKLSSNVLA